MNGSPTVQAEAEELPNRTSKHTNLPALMQAARKAAREDTGVAGFQKRAGLVGTEEIYARAASSATSAQEPGSWHRRPPGYFPFQPQYLAALDPSPPLARPQGSPPVGIETSLIQPNKDVRRLTD